jgi:hypothetical protein
MENSPSHNKLEKWGPVFDAVRKYLKDEKDEHFFGEVSRTRPNNIGVNNKALARMTDALSRIELLMSIDQTKQISVQDRETAENLVDINAELSAILGIMRTTFPNAISELILVAEQERAYREELQAELEMTKLRWKSEVANLQASLAHMSQFAKPSESSPDAPLEKKLANAESEVRRLIFSIKKKDGK